MMNLTEAERELAQRYIVADLARKALKRDLTALQGDEQALKLAPVYAQWITHAIEQVGRDLGVIKREMMRAGLRVEAKGKGGEYALYCRGYEDKANYNGVILRNYVRAYLGLFGVNKSARS